MESLASYVENVKGTYEERDGNAENDSAFTTSKKKVNGLTIAATTRKK